MYTGNRTVKTQKCLSVLYKNSLTRTSTYMWTVVMNALTGPHHKQNLPPSFVQVHQQQVANK